MSRAFVKEDGSGEQHAPVYSLPARSDPGFARAAAAALLQGARIGDTASAEEATGHRWGDIQLRPFVEQLLHEARAHHDDRLEQVAERFLRAT